MVGGDALKVALYEGQAGLRGVQHRRRRPAAVARHEPILQLAQIAKLAEGVVERLRRGDAVEALDACPQRRQAAVRRLHDRRGVHVEGALGERVELLKVLGVLGRFSAP